jgi:hypothetical protein
MAQFGTSPVIFKVEPFTGVRNVAESLSVASVATNVLTMSAAPSFSFVANTYHVISLAGASEGESRGITAISGSDITVDSAFSANPTSVMVTRKQTTVEILPDIYTMAELHAAFLADPLSVRIWTGRSWAEVDSILKYTKAEISVVANFNITDKTHLKMLSTSSGAYFHGTVGAIMNSAATPAIAIPASQVLSGGYFKAVAEGLSVDIGFHELDSNVAVDSRKTYIKTSSSFNTGSPILVKDDLFRIRLKNCNDGCYWSMGLYVKADY